MVDFECLWFQNQLLRRCGGVLLKLCTVRNGQFKYAQQPYLCSGPSDLSVWGRSACWPCKCPGWQVARAPAPPHLCYGCQMPAFTSSTSPSQQHQRLHLPPHSSWCNTQLWNRAPFVLRACYPHLGRAHKDRSWSAAHIRDIPVPPVQTPAPSVPQPACQSGAGGAACNPCSLGLYQFVRALLLS